MWIKRKDNTKADVLTRIPYCKAGKENIVNNEEDSLSVLLIATVDLFEWKNFNYAATPLIDQRLLDLRAHPDVRASQDKHQQGWLARKNKSIYIQT
jgi:hypothetical protein